MKLFLVFSSVTLLAFAVELRQEQKLEKYLSDHLFIELAREETYKLIPEKTSDNSPIGEKSKSKNEITVLNLNHYSNPRQEVQERLEQLIQRLKSFVYEVDFTGAEIDEYSEQIEGKLTEISNWVLSFSHNDRLEESLKFAKNLIFTMKSASSYVKFYNSDDTGSYLARRIVQLNVRLLILYNNQGHPDPSIEGYKDDVSTFMKILESWKNLFDELVEAPLSLRFLFESEYLKAESTLHVLKSYLPTLGQEYKNIAPKGWEMDR